MDCWPSLDGEQLDRQLRVRVAAQRNHPALEARASPVPGLQQLVGAVVQQHVILHLHLTNKPSRAKRISNIDLDVSVVTGPFPPSRCSKICGRRWQRNTCEVWGGENNIDKKTTTITQQKMPAQSLWGFKREKKRWKWNWRWHQLTKKRRLLVVTLPNTSPRYKKRLKTFSTKYAIPIYTYICRWLTIPSRRSRPSPRSRLSIGPGPPCCTVPGYKKTQFQKRGGVAELGGIFGIKTLNNTCRKMQPLIDARYGY